MAILTEEMARHLADSYPHNHDWRIERGVPKASWKLRRRARKITALYPDSVESFLDLSSSKGWFVMAAARAGIPRVLGIDVHQTDLTASRAALDVLGLQTAMLRRAHLHELVADAPQPFDLALLINTYQYLFFGSRREPNAYKNHELIFDHLASLVRPGGTLIFSNRTELKRCPGNVKERAEELGIGHLYHPTAIRDAAERHFAIQERGKLGRIPLWRLTRHA